MENFKGTIGKWVIEDDSVITDEKNIYGNIVCDSPPKEYYQSYKKWKYNAKLIAAAPELLESLQELVKWSDHLPQAANDELIAANNAIKKALE